MATKLRRFSTHTVTKAIALILAVAAVTAAIMVFLLAKRENIDPECLRIQDYSKSEDFLEEVARAAGRIENAAYSKRDLEDVEFFYYIKDDAFIRSNINPADEEKYLNSEYLITLENGYWKRDNSILDINLRYSHSEKITAYIAFPSESIQEKQVQWNLDRDTLISYYLVSGILAVSGLFLIIFLAIVTGRRSGDKDVHEGKLDRIYTDVLLAVLVGIIYLFIVFIREFYTSYMSIGNGNNEIVFDLYTDSDNQLLFTVIQYSVIIAAFTLVIIMLFLALLRKKKARRFIKHSLIYRVIRAFFRGISNLVKYLLYGDLFHEASPTKTLYYRQLTVFIFTVILFALTVFLVLSESILFILPIILEIGVLYWYYKGNDKIYQNIDQNIQISLDEMLKSERTKMALITNVSHDLKTPLTSIISYLDLLAKEEGLSATAYDYIKILQTKSDRLKNTVTDLFDLAKSTSGDIVVDYDVIDLKKLIEQTLAEMEDQISTSQMQIKTRFPETQVNVKTDGKKLYRVFQNVLDNALKYSLAGTRIYIDLKLVGDKARISVKNIAGYEMDFTAEEILQRFTRGDQARNTEGSGLGLSIAESFTKVCGGAFKVELDGDLFKVNILFNQFKEE